MNINVKTILKVAGGIGAVVAGAVSMKKATIKAAEIVKHHKEMSDMIEECAKTQPEEVYSESDKENDILINNVQTTIKLVKNYALPVGALLIGGCLLINGIFHVFKDAQVIETANAICCSVCGIECGSTICDECYYNENPDSLEIVKE